MEHAEGQQHPISIYFIVWGLLFVFSAASYAVDYYQLHGMTRWSLVLIFMVIKAAMITAYFMHMRWERLAMVLAILLPPLFIVVFMGLMTSEGHHTQSVRNLYFAQEKFVPEHP